MQKMKQQVVIRSKFGHAAGSTPGHYIRRYTTRDGAAESLTPYVKEHDVDHYLRAYMTRKDASDESVNHVETQSELGQREYKVTPRSARLFGSRGLVYDTKQYEDAIGATEKALAEGHTLITPIISFRHDFLQENNLVPKTMPEPTSKGAYMGKVDQLKLRRAISASMDAMAHKMHFNQMEWTATIQLDTKHVHAHVTAIETSDHVPEKRLVKAPVYHEENGHKKQDRDENGQLVFENKGERGLINNAVKDGMRRAMDRELTLTKSSKALTNEITAHRQLVKSHAIELSLSNTQLANTLVQIYQALPKGDGIDKEADLKENQKMWRARSNNQKMKRANELAGQYVDELLSDHSKAIEYDGFKTAVDNYAKARFPDKEYDNQAAQRQRIKTTADNRLKEQIINGLYNQLKPVRLLTTSQEEAQVQLQQANKLAGAPFGKDNDHQYIKGQVSAPGMQLAVLDDDVLNDLIADSLHDPSLSPVSSALTLEKRLRDYPRRLIKAQDEYKRYDRLTKSYDKLAAKKMVSPESSAMRELYDVERTYHKGVRDKYQYLLGENTGHTGSSHNQTYSLPLKNQSIDEWLLFNGDSIKQNAKKLPTDDFTGFTLDQKQAIEQLDPKVNQFLVEQDDSDNPDLEAICLRNSTVRNQTLIILDLKTQNDVQLELGKVDDKRFEEVRGFDLMDTMYDFDPSVTRKLAPDVVESYQDITNRRVGALQNAITYLVQSNQKDDRPYQGYRQELDATLEETQFIDVLHSMSQKPSLPRPMRQRQGKQADDMEQIKQQVVLPSEVAVDLSRELVPKVKTITKDVQEAFKPEVKSKQPNNILQEIMTINQRYIQQKKEAEELSEEEVLDTPKLKPTIQRSEMEQLVIDMFKKQTGPTNRIVTAHHNVTYEIGD